MCIMKDDLLSTVKIKIEGVSMIELSTLVVVLQKAKRDIKRYKPDLMPLYKEVRATIREIIKENGKQEVCHPFTLILDQYEFLLSFLYSFLSQQKTEDKQSPLYDQLVSLQTKLKQGVVLR